MIPTRTVGVRAYAPTEDSHGARVDAWAPEVDAIVFGWGPAGKADGDDEGNRRVTVVELELLAPEPVGNDRARWRLPGVDGVFEQQGEPNNYGHGPWWESAGVVVTLRQLGG